MALRADGGFPNRYRPDLPAFCRPAPDSSFALPLRRVSGAEENQGSRRMAPASEPAAAPWPREGPFQRADTQVRPYGRTRNRHRLVGADLCVGPSPAREGQRQRKEKRTVSPASPGLDDPKGNAFPSLITARECQPSPAGGRRSAHVRTDPPNIFSCPPAATHFLFDVSKRKWGAEGITVPR